MARRRRHTRDGRSSKEQEADLQSEVARLKAELARARDLLAAMQMGDGSETYLRAQVAAFEEGRQQARGQALEAALARNRAEGELRILRKGMQQASGLQGYFLRRFLTQFDKSVRERQPPK